MLFSIRDKGVLSKSTPDIPSIWFFSGLSGALRTCHLATHGYCECMTRPKTITMIYAD